MKATVCLRHLKDEWLDEYVISIKITNVWMNTIFQKLGKMINRWINSKCFYICAYIYLHLSK